MVTADTVQTDPYRPLHVSVSAQAMFSIIVQ